VVLGFAVLSFAFSSFLLFSAGRRNRSGFLQWYAAGLGLITVGLLGLFGVRDMGTIGAWTGRAAQYLGSVYLLLSVLLSVGGP
jgi:hypothetical protein